MLHCASSSAPASPASTRIAHSCSAHMSPFCLAIASATASDCSRTLWTSTAFCSFVTSDWKSFVTSQGPSPAHAPPSSLQAAVPMWLVLMTHTKSSPPPLGSAASPPASVLSSASTSHADIDRARLPDSLTASIAVRMSAESHVSDVDAVSSVSMRSLVASACARMAARMRCSALPRRVSRRSVQVPCKCVVQSTCGVTPHSMPKYRHTEELRGANFFRMTPYFAISVSASIQCSSDVAAPTAACAAFSSCAASRGRAAMGGWVCWDDLVCCCHKCRERRRLARVWPCVCV